MNLMMVIKDIESTYYIGNKKNPKWIKWKKFVDLDVIVLDKKNMIGGLTEYDITNTIVEKLNKELPSLKLQ